MSLKHKVIKHWESNLNLAQNKFRPHIGPSTCAYCRKYVDSNCRNCPIKAATGEIYCVGTPYYRVREAAEKLRIFPFATNVDPSLWSDLVKAIEEELEFLRSLPDDSEED